MELICDVIIRDKRTGLVVNEAKSVSSAKPINRIFGLVQE